ncbi:hypothetical protein DL96DRAFT_517834 [Flagelloscypha sp. PMI_526]|nr:hypothetical protein DL96DRAFT_517834 [Flagelloscypha sp. PMI_526]
MYEVKFEDPAQFTRIIRAAAAIADVASFSMHEESISLFAMDRAHVAVVSALIRREGMTHYRCDRPCAMTIGLRLLTNILRTCQPEEFLIISGEEDGDDVVIQLLNADESRIFTCSFHLLYLDDENPEIPEAEYDAMISMPSDVLADTIRSFLGIKSQYLAITATPKGVRFELENNTLSSKVELKASEVKIRQQLIPNHPMRALSSNDLSYKVAGKENTIAKKFGTGSTDVVVPRKKRVNAVSEKRFEDESPSQISIQLHKASTGNVSIDYLGKVLTGIKISEFASLMISAKLPLAVRFDWDHGYFVYYVAKGVDE